MKVVCILDNFINEGNYPMPIKGEIYTVDGIVNISNMTLYYLKELNYRISRGRASFVTTAFRECDSSYGPAICETIKEQIQYDEAIKE